MHEDYSVLNNSSCLDSAAKPLQQLEQEEGERAISATLRSATVRFSMPNLTMSPEKLNSGCRMLCSTATFCNNKNSGFGTPLDDNDTSYGVMITLDNNGVCRLSFCPDANFPEIHPNSYAPESLFNVHKLGGGGSGVAVFEGSHPELGDLVMKHGGDKDLDELFALATIAEELQARGETLNPRGAQELKERIPEFRMIYISPHHLGEKRRALWHRLQHLYKYSSRNLLLISHQDEAAENKSATEDKQQEQSRGLVERTLGHDPDEIQQKSKKTSMRTAAVPKVPSRNGLSMTTSGTVTGHREISIYAASNHTEDSTEKPSIELLGDSLTITIPLAATDHGVEEHVGIKKGTDEQQKTNGSKGSIAIKGDGYQALKALVNDLVKLMKDHKWKLTLGQKRIGGEDPKTGNIWLYASKLEGKLLDNLISQKIKLIQDLASLTYPEEQDPTALERVRAEVAMFEEEEVSPGQLSMEADSFVGNAIKKNFQAETGRFPVLMQLGKQFREFSCKGRCSISDISLSDGNSRELLVLTPEEVVPAHHLGSLTRPGALMGDTFENVPLEPTVLDTMNPFYWRNLLRAAVQPRRQGLMNKTSTMALRRIWTCGLTDAGLHNLFLSEDSIWLFDLGQPQLYSAPGFLTKFLFSFFHTLGMEERSDSDNGDWVRRFQVNPGSDKLRLTAETEQLLDKAYSAFEITLDRMIDELFDRDDSLRWLLIQYVTLQLFSDASFCLQRWTIKGGGRTRDSNHQKGIEKWLWRALWDMYIAFDINSRETWAQLNVEHPSHRESVFYSDMSELISKVGGEQAMTALAEIDEEEEEEGKEQ
jgi:hypothetical protein